MFDFVRAKTRAPLLASLGAGLALPLLLTHTALAQDLCGAGCPKGFTCEVQTIPCPEIACVGADCKECTPTTSASCQPLPCQADSDCDVGMVCATITGQECSGGSAAPCAADAECPKAPPETCTTTVTHECVARWTLPCSSAADCGAGFTCEEQQECSCSGSGGGAAPSSPGTGGAASSSSSSSSSSSEDCSCHPSAEKACKVIETACTSNADCVSGFTCENNPNGTCSVKRGEEPTCEPVEAAKLCTPPYSNVFGSGTATRDSSESGGIPVQGSLGAKLPDKGSASQGCSVTHVGGTGGVAPFLLALGAVVGLARRRRSR